MSVEPRPAAMTSAPCDAAPRPNACASGAEDVRMSCTVTRCRAPVSRTNPAPTASATCSSRSSGTTPRMSYALKISANSPTHRGHAPPAAAPGLRAYRLHPGLSCGLAPGGLGRWLRLGRGRTDHPQVAAPAHLHALPDRLGPRRPLALLLGNLPYRVGQSLQVVHALLHGVAGQPDHVPAAGHGQPLSVLGAQVVAVRLDVSSQRPQHRGGVAVDVRERVDGGLPACGARAATRTHRPTSLT